MKQNRADLSRLSAKCPTPEEGETGKEDISAGTEGGKQSGEFLPHLM